MEDKEKLDFIIIPTKVKLCKNLTANAKLLMGEIIALSNGKGHCWASNQYLAEIFGVDRMTISNWVNSLKKNGFIKCEVSKKNHKRNISIDRYISKSIGLYIKLYTDYISNHVHIIKAAQPLEAELPKIKDDFNIESSEWIDEQGVKHRTDSIDYES